LPEELETSVIFLSSVPDEDDGEKQIGISGDKREERN